MTNHCRSVCHRTIHHRTNHYRIVRHRTNHDRTVRHRAIHHRTNYYRTVRIGQITIGQFAILRNWEFETEKAKWPTGETEKVKRTKAKWQKANQALRWAPMRAILMFHNCEG